MPQEFNSNPNQRHITIHRDKPEKNFLQIKNENWMKVNKELGPFCLQIYLYFASNAEGYNFWISPAQMRAEAGITESTYRNYFDVLLEKGYIVDKGNNRFEFYETPRLLSDNTENLCDNTSNLQDNTPVSTDSEGSLQTKTEIDKQININNTTENKDKGKLSLTGNLPYQDPTEIFYPKGIPRYKG